MGVTAKDVMALRTITGANITGCRMALAITSGDIDRASRVLSLVGHTVRHLGDAQTFVEDFISTMQDKSARVDQELMDKRCDRLREQWNKLTGNVDGGEERPMMSRS